MWNADALVRCVKFESKRAAFSEKVSREGLFNTSSAEKKRKAWTCLTTCHLLQRLPAEWIDRFPISAHNSMINLLSLVAVLPPPTPPPHDVYHNWILFLDIDTARLYNNSIHCGGARILNGF